MGYYFVCTLCESPVLQGIMDPKFGAEPLHDYFFFFGGGKGKSYWWMRTARKFVVFDDGFKKTMSSSETVC